VGQGREGSKSVSFRSVPLAFSACVLCVDVGSIVDTWAKEEKGQSQCHSTVFHLHSLLVCLVVMRHILHLIFLALHISCGSVRSNCYHFLECRQLLINVLILIKK